MHTCSVPNRLQRATVQNTLDKILGKQHAQNNLEEKNGKDQFRVFFFVYKAKKTVVRREKSLLKLCTRDVKTTRQRVDLSVSSKVGLYFEIKSIN